MVCPGFIEYTVGLQAAPAYNGTSMDEELVASVATAIFLPLVVRWAMVR